MKCLPIFFLGCCVCACGSMAETQVVERAEMVVQSQVLHSAQVVGQDISVAVALAATPGIQVNSQGLPGGQADLSIRGSSFSGAGISLNGLALQNAQTEHFNVELPLVTGLLSAPELLTGVDQVLATEGHLVGTASFRIMPVDTGHSITLGVAEDEGYWVSTLLQEQQPFSTGDGFTGVGGFGAYTEANSVDNFDNDLRSTRGGGQFQVVTDASQWDVLVAHQTKQFGARGYYGVTPTWYAEEETEDTLLLGSWLRGDLEGRYIRASVMRREQSDNYTLYWSLPGVYSNFHRTVTHSSVVAGREFLGNHVSVNWRLNGQMERIRSNGLGNHERSRGAATLLPAVEAGRWTLIGGVRHEVFEDDASETLPQASLEWMHSDRLCLRVAHSQSVRQPSYTELNYESPASLGNTGLDNQTSETTELMASGDAGCGWGWRFGIFQRVTRNAVDWIRATDASPRWTAENLERIDTEGLEIGLSHTALGGSRIAAHYMYLHKDADVPLYSSRYALDFPVHTVLVSGLWQICRQIGVELTQTFRQQQDNPLREGGNEGYDGTLALHGLLLHYPHVQVSLMVNNLWDDDYTYFPGQSTVSPRRVSVGMTVGW